MRERADCRLCGGSLTQVFALEPMPIANSFPSQPDKAAERFPLDVMQCTDCEHVQLKQVVKGLFDDYKYETPKTAYLKESALELKEKYPTAKKVLEIGSNNGAYLDCLRDVGFWAIGMDPSASDGLSIKEPFTSSSAKGFRAKFDLVLANNVFAHIDDLRDVFVGIEKVLSTEGAVVFEVQYLPYLIERGAFDTIYHEHLDYHTLKPLAKFLKSVGLVMTEWAMIPTHGGSIRVTGKREGPEAYLPDESLRWKALREKMEASKKKLTANGRMVAFGASAKASVLINQLGLNDRILYCVDDTEKKQGRFIPGTDIQIKPVSALGGEAVLVTAWNYYDIIRQRIPNKLIDPFETR